MAIEVSSGRRRPSPAGGRIQRERGTGPDVLKG